MLSDEDKARIRLEEIYRNQVRKEVEQKTRWKHVWEILNGSFCLWAMSTIVLSFGTWLYTRYTEAADKRRQSHHLATMLDIELKFRLIKFRDELQALKLTLDRRAKSDEDRSDPELAHTLEVLAREVTQPETTAFPEFKQRSLFSLLLQLETIETEPKADQFNLKKHPEMKEPRALTNLIHEAHADPRTSVIEKSIDETLDRLKNGPLSRWANPPGLRDSLQESTAQLDPSAVSSTQTKPRSQP
jgi:hypothetical protein